MSGLVRLPGDVLREIFLLVGEDGRAGVLLGSTCKRFERLGSVCVDVPEGSGHTWRSYLTGRYVCKSGDERRWATDLGVYQRRDFGADGLEEMAPWTSTSVQVRSPLGEIQVCLHGVGQFIEAEVDTPGRLLPWQLFPSGARQKDGYTSLRWQHVAGRIGRRHVYVLRERVNGVWYYLTYMTGRRDPVNKEEILRVSTEMDSCFSMHGFGETDGRWRSLVSVRGTERGAVHLQWGLLAESLSGGKFYDELRQNSELGVVLGIGEVRWAKVGWNLHHSRMMLVAEVDRRIVSFFVQGGPGAEERTTALAVEVYELDAFSAEMPARFTLDGVRIACVHKILTIRVFSYAGGAEVEETTNPKGMFPVRVCHGASGLVVLYGRVGTQNSPVLLMQTLECLPLLIGCW